MLAVIIICLVAFVSLPAQSKKRTMKGKSRPRRRPSPHKVSLDIGMLMAEVATRLRSGASVESAWERSLAPLGGIGGRIGADGIPQTLRTIWELGWWERKKRRISKGAHAAIPSAFVVCRMSAGTGAPVADVLDACASGITDAGEAASARDIALAGPQTSAFMLAALPGVGIGFGTMLGANPLGFFFSSIIGAGVLILGLSAEFAGIWWVWRLVAKARKESEEM